MTRLLASMLILVSPVLCSGKAYCAEKWQIAPFAPRFSYSRMDTVQRQSYVGGYVNGYAEGLFEGWKLRGKAILNTPANTDELYDEGYMEQHEQASKTKNSFELVKDLIDWCWIEENAPSVSEGDVVYVINLPGMETKNDMKKKLLTIQDNYDKQK